MPLPQPELNPGSGRSFVRHVLQFPVPLCRWGTCSPAKLSGILTFKFVGGKIILLVCISLQRPLGHLPLVPDVCRTTRKKVVPKVSCWRAWRLGGIYTAVQGKLKSLLPAVPSLASPCSEYSDAHLPWASYSACHGDRLFWCQVNMCSLWLYRVLH